MHFSTRVATQANDCNSPITCDACTVRPLSLRHAMHSRYSMMTLSWSVGYLQLGRGVWLHDLSHVHHQLAHGPSHGASLHHKAARYLRGHLLQRHVGALLPLHAGRHSTGASCRHVQCTACSLAVPRGLLLPSAVHVADLPSSPLCIYGSRAITQTNANDLIPRCAGVGPIRLLQHTGQLSTLSNEISPRDAALHLFAGNRTASAISYSSAEVWEEPSFT